jgi:hypothetical protein
MFGHKNKLHKVYGAGRSDARAGGLLLRKGEMARQGGSPSKNVVKKELKCSGPTALREGDLIGGDGFAPVFEPY